MIEHERNCRVCHWWEPWPENLDHDIPPKLKARQGTCHRYPASVPSSDKEDRTATWVETGCSDWCGEWRQEEYKEA